MIIIFINIFSFYFKKIIKNYNFFQLYSNRYYFQLSNIYRIRKKEGGLRVAVFKFFCYFFDYIQGTQLYASVCIENLYYL